MQRTDNEQLREIVNTVLATGEGALANELKWRLFHDLAGRSPEGAMLVFSELMRRLHGLDEGLVDSKNRVKELHLKMEELLGKVWYPATFIGFMGASTERNAMVVHGNACRVVGVDDQVPVEHLAKGCEILLNRELTAIVARSPRPCRPTGQIATVVEKTARGTVVLNSHEEEIEAELAAAIADVPIKQGDRVRWDPSACMAFELIEQSESKQYLLGETPFVPLDAVGGQDENVRKLLGVLSAVLINPSRAAEYGLSGRSSILIQGGPGVGKTLMVRAVVSEIGRMTGRIARFYVVKPAEWESCLVGNTEKNIRQLFATVRKGTEDGSLAIIYLDEVDCVGRARGHIQGHFSDKALNALLAELDGFAGREGVAVVATTNRKDLIDSALLQRLTDHEIQVRPPDMLGAKAIFAIHLRSSLPFNPNGTQASETRKEMIETAVARIYNPNSQFAELCRLKFRDGKTRTVSAKDLACGRLFQQICGAAKLAAYQRELRGGEPGLCVRDIDDAIASAMERLSTNITIHSVRNQLPDLPTDVDVVSVEPIRHRVDRPHRYIVESSSAA